MIDVVIIKKYDKLSVEGVDRGNIIKIMFPDCGMTKRAAYLTFLHFNGGVPQTACFYLLWCGNVQIPHEPYEKKKPVTDTDNWLLSKRIM